MDRVPFGVTRLDGVIGGGAPPGSVVLLSGEAGAGAREFMYTSAVMTGLARAEHDLFDLHYGSLADSATLPDETHYVSFTAEEESLRREISMAMDQEMAAPGLDEIEFISLSKQFFHVSPVPREWYAEETGDIRNLRKRHEEREGLLSTLGEEVSERAPGNLLIIDSLSDLVGAIDDDLEWADVNYLVMGLQRAAREWGCLILLHVNRETLSATRHGQLVDATSGTMEFAWESGGSTRARTLVIKSFRGVLSRIEDENIVEFETDLGDAGFDVSDVRKIR